MITIAYPHMGLNAVDAPVHVRMWNTRLVQGGETRRKIVDDVVAVARGAPGGKLAELVISCHGAPGYLQLGEGVRTADVGVFQAWRGLVDKVWVRACLVGRIIGPDTAGQGDGAFLTANSFSGDGHRFCQALARALQSYLVVGTELQYGGGFNNTDRLLPFGQLDTYEGLVLSYHPDGTVGWWRRYPSGVITNQQTGAGWTPNRG